MNQIQVQKFSTEVDLAKTLATTYMKQINNYFSDEKQALKFLSGVRAAVQRLPALLDCEGGSVINSFMIMAQLELMPSSVSGEAYVLPYGGIAQFQLGYQGLVTLFYRAGVTAIYSDVVREGDQIELVNGGVHHKVDPKKSNKERGKEIGAYVVVTFKGTTMGKYMHADDILAIGKKFSKSFNTKFTPWNEDNDPEKWMWKKTVLKQMAKLLPKNETINKAIAEDNKDSIISDRLDTATKESDNLKMGNLLKAKNEKNNNKEGQNESENQDQVTGAEGIETIE